MCVSFCLDQTQRAQKKHQEATEKRNNTVNGVIADKNFVTKIMNNSTGLQHIEFTGFAKNHWKNCYYPVAYGWCLGLF